MGNFRTNTPDFITLLTYRPMKSQLISLVLILWVVMMGYAQEFDVREFTAQPNDISARRYEKKTVNDEPAAIIKVVTNISGMIFESNLGVVDMEIKNDGYWIWVGPRERSIKLLAPGYLPHEVNLPEPARPQMVYKLVVAATGTMATVSDLVKVTFRINESNVFIRLGESAPVEAVSRTPFYNLPRGRHTFRFFKQDFMDQEITLDVQSEQVVDIAMQPGQTTGTMALKGWILINSDPSGAEVFLNDQRVGTTPYQQSHVAGNYALRLQFPMHQIHQTSFQLSEGANVNLPTITLVPRFGYWQVNSVPPGAEVFLNDQLQGTTPLARSQIESGMHRVMLRYSNYHEHRQTILITNGEFEKLQINLRPAFGGLVITSEPTGAKLFLNNREVGTTPYRNNMLPSGIYTISLAKEMYSGGNDVASVKDGETTERFIAMSQNFGIMKVTAPGSEIFINGQSVGTGAYTGNHTPGPYRVKATRQHHKDDERDVFITLGRTESVTLAPLPRQGIISISSLPFETQGAQIFINGQRQPQTTPATFPLMIGSYDVTLKKSGYTETTRRVDIAEGREQSVVFQMHTFAGSMQQKALSYRRAKQAYGMGTLAAAAAGGYFIYSSRNLADSYPLATTDATITYDRMKQHKMISYISFGAAVPLGVFYLVKAGQQRSTQRRVNFSALPAEGGAVVGVRIKVGE